MSYVVHCEALLPRNLDWEACGKQRRGFSRSVPCSSRPPANSAETHRDWCTAENTLARTQFASLDVIIWPSSCRLLVDRFAGVSQTHRRLSSLRQLPVPGES